MADSVPRLVPRRPARSLQLLGLASRGIREVTGQIESYTAWWDEQNQRAAAAEGPLLVAIGDSTAIGIGASTPEASYVGLMRRALVELDGRPWRVVNLAVSGARLDDALERQLPILAGLTPAIVTCCVGTNDLVWGRGTTTLRAKLHQLVNGLPPEAIVGSLAGASARGQLANRALRNATTERGLVLVNPWSEPGPPAGQRLAADRFHPNDLGYQLMARPFGRELGIAYNDPTDRPEGAGALHDGDTADR